jgi:hypothetical protein
MACPICGKEHPYKIPEAVNRLAAAPRRLEKFASSLTPRLAAGRPAPGKWSAKEIICHLADCEIAYGFRYRKIISESDPVLIPFDQEAWAKNLKYEAQSLKSALVTFSALRNSHVALFKSLSPKTWKKTGQHLEYGPLTLGQIVTHLVEHDLNHIAQVERLSAPPAKLTGKTSVKPAARARPRSRRAG